MGKVKREARKHSNHHDNPANGRSAVVRRQHSQKQAAPAKPPPAVKNRGPPVRPKIPFTKYDSILLLGEGDFSFTLALKLHHKFHHVTSTCFDSREALHTKYPGVESTMLQIAPDDLHMDGDLQESLNGESEWNGFSPSPPRLETRAKKIDVLYGIDATKLSSTHRKVLRASGPFTKIVFNFPHVGGMSTDVNRQVRHNQELLVGFFKAAKDLLSSPSRPARTAAQSEMYDSDDEYASDDLHDVGAVHGQILVTIFEGEPYTLWNIRDLARHSGLKVVESFKFPWSAYPGYQHARTIGSITSGKDREEDGKRKGAWRGEERDARCYVLEDRDAGSKPVRGKANKRKRNEAEAVGE